jgi:hypothetical protein
VTRLLIVGGSDAGISAGLRAWEVDPTIEPLLVVDDAYPNFSICGIPYHVSGEVPDWRSLAHRTRADLEAAGLELRLNTHARAIDPVGRTLTCHICRRSAAPTTRSRLPHTRGRWPRNQRAPADPSSPMGAEP